MARGALGARGYFEPGAGGVIRGEVGWWAPLGALRFTVDAGLELGVARLGEDLPSTGPVGRIDLAVGVAWSH